MSNYCPCTRCFECCCGRSEDDCVNAEDGRCECVRCPTCHILVPEARAELGYKTCIKHSDEKPKNHQPGVVNSLGLHEKYFPEGR